MDMKIISKYYALSSLLFLLMLFISCSTYKPIAIADQVLNSGFNESFEKWTKLKKVHDSSYEYAVSYSSWVGWRATTKILVKEGKIISRQYAETQQDDEGQWSLDEVLIFTELQREINKHEKGFKAVLFDQIYTDCGNNSLQMSPAENHITFTADNQGILQSCGYTDRLCVDDCYMGVRITSFKWMD